MKKKYRKLAVQVGITLTIILLITNTLTAFITISGTKNMYLESKNEKLVFDIRFYDDLLLNPELTPTFVDAW